MISAIMKSGLRLQLMRCSAYDNLDCPDSCKVSTQWDEIVDEARRWYWGGKIGIAPWLDIEYSLQFLSNLLFRSFHLLEQSIKSY